jgi:hypothetical protein
MMVFVWKALDHVSDRYHENGGLVVFASSLERAIAIASEKGAIANDKPDEVRKTQGQEAVYIMENAGCC